MKKITLRNTVKNFVMLIIVMCFAQEVLADDAPTIANYIISATYGDLNATVSGNTVTVIGTISATPSNAHFLTFNINSGVEVVWQATLVGNTTTKYALVVICGSGTFDLQSDGSIKNIGAGTAILNQYASVLISGGFVEAKSGNAIRNEYGAVYISGGIVSTSNGNVIENVSNSYATRSDIYISGGSVIATKGFAIYNPGSKGKVNISGGIVQNKNVSANNDIFMDGAIGNYGILRISGGNVSAKNDNAISIFNEGTLEITGGIIASTTAAAIRGFYIRDINISGNPIITSENPNGGTIHVATQLLTINGGTIENTASGAAIYFECKGLYTKHHLNVNGGIVKSERGSAITTDESLIINVTGGTISTNSNDKSVINVHKEFAEITITGGSVLAKGSNSFSLYSETPKNLMIILGGNPTITGKMIAFPDKLKVIDEGENKFTPDSKKYILELPTDQYIADKIAVVNGRAYFDNFELFNKNWGLTKIGAHLAISSK